MEDNIVSFPGYFNLRDDNEKPNLTVDNVLQGVVDNEVKEVVVVGTDMNGDLYLASNIPSIAKFVYLLEVAKARLINADFEQG